jgi:tetratricopeptide (TPR) repeat protein
MSAEDQAAEAINAGCDLHAAGDLRGALAKYREALALDSFDAVTHFNVGVALDDLGDKQGALKEYGRALALDPGFEDAEFNYNRLAPRRWKRPDQQASLALPVEPVSFVRLDCGCKDRVQGGRQTSFIRYRSCDVHGAAHRDDVAAEEAVHLAGLARLLEAAHGPGWKAKLETPQPPRTFVSPLTGQTVVLQPWQTFHADQVKPLNSRLDALRPRCCDMKPNYCGGKCDWSEA